MLNNGRSYIISMMSPLSPSLDPRNFTKSWTENQTQVYLCMYGWMYTDFLIYTIYYILYIIYDIYYMIHYILYIIYYILYIIYYILYIIYYIYIYIYDIIYVYTCTYTHIQCTYTHIQIFNTYIYICIHTRLFGICSQQYEWWLWVPEKLPYSTTLTTYPCD